QRTTAWRLEHDDGVNGGSGHFRLLYESAERVPGHLEAPYARVFEVVRGAEIGGAGTPGDDVEIATSVLGHRYVRHGRADAAGRWSIRVAYPGAYTMPGGFTITISEQDLR